MIVVEVIDIGDNVSMRCYYEDVIHTAQILWFRKLFSEDYEENIMRVLVDENTQPKETVDVPYQYRHKVSMARGLGERDEGFMGGMGKCRLDGESWRKV